MHCDFLFSNTEHDENFLELSLPLTIPIVPAFLFQYLDEVYTTEHWMVRIYKVRKNINRGAPAKKLPSK
jgi:hypothetical protein